MSKLSKDGYLQWVLSVDTNNWAEFTSLAADFDNHIWVSIFYDYSDRQVSIISSSQTFDLDMKYKSCLMKINELGRVIWYTFATGETRFHTVTVGESGTAFVAGVTSSTEVFFFNTDTSIGLRLQATQGQSGFGFVVCYDSSGSVCGALKIDGTRQLSFNSLNIGRDGLLHIAGEYRSTSLIFRTITDEIIMTLPNQGITDGFLIRLNSSYLTSLSFSSKQRSSSELKRVITQVDIAVPRTTSLQIPVNNPIQTSSNLLWISILVASLIFVFLSAIFIYIFVWRRIQIRKLLQTESTRKITTEPTSTAVTSSVLHSSLSTWLATNHELSIPAFLEMKFQIDFKQGYFIAKGGGGSLYTCSCLSADLAELCGQQDLVVKRVADSMDQMTMRTMNAFWQEVAMMWRFRDHPNFCKVYAYSLTPVCIVMKYYPLGDLRVYIRNYGPAATRFPYTKLSLVHIAKQYCQGIAFMHANGFVHCDIKPANVLLDDQNGVLSVIVTDFGISRVVMNELDVKAFIVSDLNGASIQYAAPDVLVRFRRPNRETAPEILKCGDAYGLAMSLYELMNRCAPWNYQ